MLFIPRVSLVPGNCATHLHRQLHKGIPGNSPLQPNKQCHSKVRFYKNYRTVEKAILKQLLRRKRNSHKCCTYFCWFLWYKWLSTGTSGSTALEFQWPCLWQGSQGSLHSQVACYYHHHRFEDLNSPCSFGPTFKLCYLALVLKAEDAGWWNERVGKNQTCLGRTNLDFPSTWSHTCTLTQGSFAQKPGSHLQLRDWALVGSGTTCQALGDGFGFKGKSLFKLKHYIANPCFRFYLAKSNSVTVQKRAQ